MKTDDDSEEAGEPPGRDSGTMKNPVPDANEENAEPVNPRRDMRNGPAPGLESHKDGAHTRQPMTEPAAQTMFRETGLLNRQPGSRKYRAGLPAISEVPI